MDILFLGLNGIGRRVYDWLIDQGEQILCIITDPEQLDLIEQLQPDMIISGGFRHIVPERYLDIPSAGAINFHKSILPWNRGANPNVWSIIEDTPVGVSLHYMDDGIDTGPVIARRDVSLHMDDTGKTLYQKLEDAQFEIFTDIWPELKAGEIDPEPQEHTGTFHERIEFDRLCEIDPEAEYRAIDLINLLRALTFPPYRNARIEVDGETYYLNLNIEKPGDE